MPCICTSVWLSLIITVLFGSITWVPNTSDARMYVRISTEYHVNFDSIRIPHLSLLEPVITVL